MRANIIACLPSVGFFGRLPALGSGIPPQEKFSHGKDASADGRPDAYKVAVLLLAGATLLSLSFSSRRTGPPLGTLTHAIALS
jgi:hypothetical protein